MFMFLLLYRVCTHVILVILAPRFCIYVCVGLDGMYTCNAGNFGTERMCLCFCF